MNRQFSRIENQHYWTTLVSYYKKNIYRSLRNHLSAILENQSGKNAEACNFGKTSAHIMTLFQKCLTLFPFKTEKQTPIQMSSVDNKKIFANDQMRIIQCVNINVNCIWFSEEAHFHLYSFINKKNWRIWRTMNFYMCIPQSVYSPKVTVRAAVSRRGVIGPFFLRDKVTSKRYIQILHEFVVLEHVLHNLSKASQFMQDSSRPLQIADIFSFLKKYFDNRVLSLNYPCFTGKGIDWPPYSPDFNSFYFIFWGPLKDAIQRKNVKCSEHMSKLKIQSVTNVQLFLVFIGIH